MSDTISTLAQKLRPHWLRDVANVTTTAAGSGTAGVTDHGALTGLLDDDHPQYLTPARGDVRYLTATRTLTAGAGLTGGGDLTADRTFTVGAGTLITVGADDVGITAGANYQFIGTGAGTAAAWQNISTLAGNGLTAATGVLAVGVANTGAAGLTVEADAVRLTSSSSPGQAAAVLATDANGALTLYNGFFTQGAQSAATFASGWAGSGWRADYGITTASRASIETDDLTVRGRMRVYELLIQQIRATNGSLLVTSSSKVVTVTTSSNPLWTVNGSQLTFNGNDATLTFTLYTIATSTSAEDAASKRTYHGFLYGDIIRAQQVEWNGSSFAGVIQSNLEVTGVSNLYTYDAAFVSGDAPAVGYDFVRLGNVSDSSRRGVVYLTSDDSAAPFIDIVDNISYHSDWNSAGAIKARLGKLTGISDTDFGGALSGYGLYSTNVYLKGNIYATSGIFNGTVYASAGSFTGTVYASAGSFTGAVTATSGSFTGSLTSTSGTIGGWTLGTTSLTAGSGANTVGLDSGGTNPALYAGSATPASAPFRVTKTGDLTATSATIAGDFSVASSTFGNAGVQMQYNSNSPRFYVGDGANAYLKYETATGYPIASGIYIQGASYVTGSVYAGNSAVRLSTDGVRMVLPDLAAPNAKTTIPSNSSAMRWMASISDTWTNVKNYTGQIGYRDTSNKVVDWVAMSYVGSTDYATYYARAMLYANRYNGSTDKECRLEVAVDPGTGGAYVTATCDTMYTSSNLYVTSNCSALSFTDRTPHYEGDALAELRQVRGKTRTVRGKQIKEIDHATLPAFARVTLQRGADKQPEEGRDLGAMVSILTVAVQQLADRLDALEGRGNGRQ